MLTANSDHFDDIFDCMAPVLILLNRRDYIVLFLRTTPSEVEINTRTPANMTIFHGMLLPSGGSPVLGSLGMMTVVVAIAR